jgi:large subunit ribosomal protein L13
MKTTLPNRNELQKKAKWYLIDAADKVLGKVATQAARVLAGKDRIDFTPSIDLGDGVIIINAEKVRITGKKSTDKLYYRHSGYKGNIKEFSAGDLIKNDPKKIFDLAVVGMLPKNKLRDARMMRLKVYNGTTHPHSAQEPIVLTV